MLEQEKRVMVRDWLRNQARIRGGPVGTGPLLAF